MTRKSKSSSEGEASTFGDKEEEKEEVRTKVEPFSQTPVTPLLKEETEEEEEDEEEEAEVSFTPVTPLVAKKTDSSTVKMSPFEAYRTVTSILQEEAQDTFFQNSFDSSTEDSDVVQFSSDCDAYSAASDIVEVVWNNIEEEQEARIEPKIPTPIRATTPTWRKVTKLTKEFFIKGFAKDSILKMFTKFQTKFASLNAKKRPRILRVGCSGSGRFCGQDAPTIPTRDEESRCDVHLQTDGQRHHMREV